MSASEYWPEHAVQIHGFVSQGYMKSTANNYLAKTRRGTAEFTELGVNFTAQLTEKLRGGLQLLSYNLGNAGNFGVVLDWGFLDYQLEPWLGVRAGHLKVTRGLYNDVRDIDSARVSVLQPQSVYDQGLRHVELAMSGTSIYGEFGLGAAGALAYDVFAGSSPLEIPAFEAEMRYIVGGRLVWNTPLQGLRLAGSYQRLSFRVQMDLDPTQVAQLKMAQMVPADFDGTVVIDLPDFTNWIGSLEYAMGDFSFAAEYSRRTGENKSSLPAVVPDDEMNTEGLYALATYRFAPWGALGAYYSVFFVDAADRDGKGSNGSFEKPSQAYQHDAALTIRFDINEYWLVKLEGHYLEGTAALFPIQGGGYHDDSSTVEDEWGLFLAKTTIAF